MYKVFLKYPESLRPAFPRLKEKLEDPDPGIRIQWTYSIIQKTLIYCYGKEKNHLLAFLVVTLARDTAKKNANMVLKEVIYTTF